MDRTALEEFTGAVHRDELFANVRTATEVGDPKSYHLVDILLLAVPFVHEFIGRITTFRRSRILSRLVEFRNDRLFLA